MGEKQRQKASQGAASEEIRTMGRRMVVGSRGRGGINASVFV